MELNIQPKTSLPIKKIFCIGRNYAAHARELGNQVPEQPVVFMKSANALWPADRPIPIPHHGTDLHHEAELVVAIGREGKNIPEDEALTYVAGYGIGLDLTLRDVQQNLKAKGLPWELAKSFDASAPLGIFTNSVPDLDNLQITCHVNDELRQNGNTRDMIYSIPFLISFLSGIFTLQPGDLIFTGTPEGVGPLKAGDRIRIEISHIGASDFMMEA